jgi:ATP-dependent DNA helicase RecG
LDLITLISRPEGKTLEFKRDLSSPDGVLKAIVTFANTSGGVLVLGVEDGTKRVKGIPNILAEEERLANLIADSISPRLVPSIEVMRWRKTQVLAVEIYPSASRPHFLNRLGPEEGVFVRVGSTNRRADLFLVEETRFTQTLKSRIRSCVPGYRAYSPGCQRNMSTVRRHLGLARQTEPPRPFRRVT